MDQNYKETLNRIKTFIFDVDGVFTDGIVILTNEGEQMRTANVRDGYAIQLAVKLDYRVVIITGGGQEAVRKRFEGLGVTDIFLRSKDKMSVMMDFVEANNLDLNEVCYMGDDIPDYYTMQKVALAACPADAVPEIKEISHYISPYKGGQGCVRDIVEQTLKVQNKWLQNGATHW